MIPSWQREEPQTALGLRIQDTHSQHQVTCSQETSKGGCGWVITASEREESPRNAVGGVGGGLCASWSSTLGNACLPCWGHTLVSRG